MKTVQLLTLGLLAVLAWPAARAEAHGRGFVSVGVGVGAPCGRWGGYGCGPWGGCGWYRPYPAVYYGVYLPPPPPRIIVQPAIVQPAPVVLQQAPVSAEPPVIEQSPAPRPVAPAMTSAAVVSRSDSSAIEEHLRNLADPDEGMRQNAVQELGRANATRAIDPLAATLAGDASPAVRETAARALGIIASPRALPALTRAAQADTDRDVRRSAQFAVEIIHSRMKER